MLCHNISDFEFNQQSFILEILKFMMMKYKWNKLTENNSILFFSNHEHRCKQLSKTS